MTEIIANPFQALTGVDNRQNFVHMAAAMSEMDTAFEHPFWHYEAKGLFGRRATAPAGSCIVTYVHKQEHFTVALSGRCLVVDQDGNKTEVEAPQVWITKPGTQRAILALTDVEWFCAYAHDGGIPDNPEEVFCCRSFEEYDEYLKALPAPGVE